MGEVLMLSHVRIEVESGDKKERLLLFFPGLLIVLSVTPRVNGYFYEVSLSCLTASRTLRGAEGGGGEVLVLAEGDLIIVWMSCHHLHRRHLCPWVENR